jgi:dTDP-4-amino-4,6-dideoxygalactose transaminase
MDDILSVAKEHDLIVVEDAAQAHGASIGGRRIGAHGHAVCWSFYPGKNLGALGDGGAVTTNDDDVADRLRLLRNYGSKRKYEHEIAGTNSRLDELQAALLHVKLQHLETWNARRRNIVARYHARLSPLGFWLQRAGEGVQSSHHLMVTQSLHRDALRDFLDKCGVETLVHYPIPPHMQPAYASFNSTLRPLPETVQLANEVVSLPIGPHLSLDQVDYVCDCIKEAVAREIALPTPARSDA